MRAAIKVEDLTKVFCTRQLQPGFLGILKSLFNPTIHKAVAIAPLSFTIAPGEKVAFIGPNGAGKSTTIKMLTGILYPTSGQVEVLGLVPWKQRHSLGYRIGTVFGQRTQLWTNLPPIDTFSLLAKIYEIDAATYKKRLHELIDIFELHGFLHKFVRQLSLGERMRCELVASLLHMPEILFLDEPTIGLDVHAKLQIRTLLNRLTSERGTTLFLTSHDMADVEQITKRVLVLDKGHLIIDSTISELKKTYRQKKVLHLITEGEAPRLHLPGVTLLQSDANHVSYEIDTATHPIDQVIQKVLHLAKIKDITIGEPSMEEIIRELYVARKV